MLPFLDPLPRWEVTQPGNVLRVFERGGRKQAGDRHPDPRRGARPARRQAERPRLRHAELAPTRSSSACRRRACSIRCSSFLGTNDQPGDYRSSGCTACHVVYANDRSPVTPARTPQFGNDGRTPDRRSDDPASDEPGHPIKHAFTRSIPSSQCMTCHMHPGTNMVDDLLRLHVVGQRDRRRADVPDGAAQAVASVRAGAHRERNPEGGGAARACGPTPSSSTRSARPSSTSSSKHTQFADFHGHGWVFRAVFKHDRKGNLLDADDKIVAARRSRASSTRPST